VWFTEAYAIGRMTREAAVTEYEGGPSGVEPARIVAAANGDLWFTQPFGALSKISSTGKIATTVLPASSGDPTDVAADAAGNLWFTEPGAGRIGRRAASGRLTEYEVGRRRIPRGIATAPDGTVWFAELGDDRIARITPSGRVTNAAEALAPSAVAAAPDGTIWFAESGTSAVGRIGLDGAVTRYSVIPVSDVLSVAVAVDGTAWFEAWAKPGVGILGQIASDGSIVQYRSGIPRGSMGPGTLVADPRGGMWFADAERDAIGRVTPAGEITEYVSRFARTPR
jgi:virginiamycin B lyase